MWSTCSSSTMTTAKAYWWWWFSAYICFDWGLLQKRLLSSNRHVIGELGRWSGLVPIGQSRMMLAYLLVFYSCTCVEPSGCFQLPVASLMKEITAALVDTPQHLLCVELKVASMQLQWVSYSQHQAEGRMASPLLIYVECCDTTKVPMGGTYPTALGRLF